MCYTTEVSEPIHVHATEDRPSSGIDLLVEYARSHVVVSVPIRSSPMPNIVRQLSIVNVSLIRPPTSSSASSSASASASSQ